MLEYELSIREESIIFIAPVFDLFAKSFLDVPFFINLSDDFENSGVLLNDLYYWPEFLS